MTFSSSDIADALRWFWVACGIIWIVYAWLHRIAYTRVLLGIVGLVALDWVLHAFADFSEEPGSKIPSDFEVYSVWMLVAGLVGLGVACLFGRWRRIPVITVIDGALVCIVAGGIGGRAYHVWTNWNFYSENTDFITDLSQGGFGIRGALILGFIALVLFAWITRNSFWRLADVTIIGLAVAQSIGWYAAYITHTHYGIPLEAPAPVGPFAPLAQIVRAFGYNFVQALPDSYNIIAFRIPMQLLSAIFYFALFFILLWRAYAHPARAGLLIADYWILAALAGFLLGFWRGDETLRWNGLRVDQWIDFGLFLGGLALAGGQYLSRLQRGRVAVSERRLFQQT